VNLSKFSHKSLWRWPGKHVYTWNTGSLARWFLAELNSSTLKMEAISSSETSVDTKRTARRYIPEDFSLLYIISLTPLIRKRNAKVILLKIWPQDGSINDIVVCRYYTIELYYNAELYWNRVHLVIILILSMYILKGSNDGVQHSGLLVFGLCLSSGILKNTTFRKLDVSFLRWRGRHLLFWVP
jgi:hypothetical protein